MPCHSKHETKRKSKRARFENSSYHPGQKIYGSSPYKKDQRACILRMDNRKVITFANNANISIPVETAVYIVRQPDLPNFDKLEAELQQQFKTKIPTHTFISGIHKKSADGLPLEVTSPGGTTLIANRFDGNMVYLSNLTNKIRLDLLPKITSLPNDSNFLLSSPYKAVIKPTTNEKIQSCIITKEDYLAARKQFDMNGGRRGCSQAEVMKENEADINKARTTNYIAATKLFPDKRYEASHIRPWNSLGDETQDVDNIAYMTNAANTEMMPIEDVLKHKAMNAPVKYDVVAPLIEGTHIAKDEVTIQIMTPKKSSVTFRIDPQNPNVPHCSQMKYISLFCSSPLGFFVKKDTLKKGLQEASASSNIPERNPIKRKLFQK